MSWKCHIGKVDNRKLVVFRLPSEIGFYSSHGQNDFHDDDSQMKWIYTQPSSREGHLIAPDLNWDLNEGYSSAILKDPNERGKRKMLHWMLRHQEKIRRVFLSPKSNEPKIDFVCARGLLTKICATLYDSRNDWAFCASKYKSIIYMRRLETERHIYERENETERAKLMTFWGAKFEQYMTCDTPNSEPNTSTPVNELEKYYIVLKGQINGYTLLYNAEVDGKNPEYQQSNTGTNEDMKSSDCYVELKTTKSNAFRGRYDREKLLKWWLQSFLAGVPKIICGYRDENGIIKKLETFSVKDIPEIAKDSWNKNVCLKFCYYILNFIKTCVVEDNPEIVYTFHYELGSPYVKCKKLDSPVEGRILPEWFTDEYDI